MSKTKILAVNKKHLALLAQFAVLLAIATLAPLFHYQPFTGPVVNAVLFLSAALLGVDWAIMVGLIPSLIALSVGLLPAVLSPAVPFIMVSNAILIVVFFYLKQKNFWLAVVSASVLKFLFLFSSSYIVVNLIAKEPVAQKAAQMLSYPQLLTALAGGVIAYLVLKILKGRQAI